MLALNNIGKRFGGHQVLDGVSFTAGYGEVCALLGPNGAGKSTLLNVVAGFLSPSSGQVTLEGRTISGQPPDRLARMGLRKVSQTTRLWESLSVYENLVVAREHAEAGLPVASGPAARQRAVDEALALTALGPFADRLPGRLSAGQRRILGITLALLGEPRVLLLDEPSATLDRANAARVFDYVRRIHRHDRILVLVEHNLHFLEDFATSAVFLHRGAVRATGTYASIVAREDLRQLYLGLAA